MGNTTPRHFSILECLFSCFYWTKQQRILAQKARWLRRSNSLCDAGPVPSGDQEQRIVTSTRGINMNPIFIHLPFHSFFIFFVIFWGGFSVHPAHVCLSAQLASHSCENDISRTLGGISFFRCGTNFLSDQLWLLANLKGVANIHVHVLI